MPVKTIVMMSWIYLAQIKMPNALYIEATLHLHHNHTMVVVSYMCSPVGGQTDKRMAASLHQWTLGEPAKITYIHTRQCG